jgi:hypothetical protein
MQQQFSSNQNAGAQPVGYQDHQMRRVPTWPYINGVTTNNFGNQYYSSMSMYPDGQPAHFFPRSCSLNSMSEVIVPMTGVIQGNTDPLQPGLMAFPSMGAGHYMPTQFVSPQGNQEAHAACAQSIGYQQHPIQAWHYNHYTNQPPGAVQYQQPQQTVMYNIGSEAEATQKPRKPPLTRKPNEYAQDASPFHCSNIRHHIMLNKQIQWPRLIYETQCTESSNAQQSVEKSTGGKDTSKSSDKLSSMLFMPTHRPKSPKIKKWKGERKVRFRPKKPAKRIKRKNRSVDQVLKSCAKKIRESSTQPGNKKRQKRPPAPTPSKEETEVKEVPLKPMLPPSLGYSQTPPESSDEDSEEIETEIVGQPVDSNIAMRSIDGRVGNDLEMLSKSSSSCAPKLVCAPPLPKSYSAEILSEKPMELFTYSQKVSTMVAPQVSKHDKRLDSKGKPARVIEELVLPVRNDLVLQKELYSKELTPTAFHSPSEITTPGSSCRLAGMKPPIPYTPSPEILIKPKVTPKPTVPPLKRVDWLPAPLVSEFNNLPLIIERTVKDDPWQTVKRRKHGNVPEISLSSSTPELFATPPSSKKVLSPKEQKKSRKRRKRKKTRVLECAKVEESTPIPTPEKPLAPASSSRKNTCDLVMDCLNRIFCSAWKKDKTT